MTLSKALRLLLGLLLAVLFAWLTLRQVALVDITTTFATADLGWILAALVAFGVDYACRIERWRLMLKVDNAELSWRACAGPFMASFAANNLLPFRAGDVLRCFAFNTKLRTTSGVVVATLLAERLLDLLMVFAMFAAALLFVDPRSIGLSLAGSMVLMAGAAVILLSLCYPDAFRPFARWAARAATRFSPQIGAKVLHEAEKCISTVGNLAHGGMMARLVSWSLLAWLAEGCVYWFGALALRSITAPLASWAALPIGTLATLIPSTPGYIGTFDYFTARAMRELGNPTVATTAYALLIHVLLWLPATAIGGVYLLSQVERESLNRPA
jgi:uncharacterized protein (TIRG00374 family)